MLQIQVKVVYEFSRNLNMLENLNVNTTTTYLESSSSKNELLSALFESSVIITLMLEMT